MLTRGRRIGTLVMAIVVAASIAWAAVAAQTPPASTTSPPAQARTTPEELLASREAARLSDPAARVEAYDAILAKYPNSPYLVDFHVQRMAALEAMAPVDLAAIDAEIAKTRTAQTPRTPHEVLNLIAMTLLTSDATVRRAETLEREAIGMLDEETYARDWQKRYTKHPDDPKELAAQYKEGKNRFAGDLSRYELILGRILVKEGRDADATTAFERALAVVPLQGSASLALATLAEKAGNTTEAYRRLAWAAITGRLPAADRPRLAAAYATLHPSAPDDALEADLDRLFRESFTNPIATSRYSASPARSARTVLAEMFTGSGCVPCLSVDLSFEAMLERYSRDEVVVLMYHIHAPTTDPLSNRSVQARGTYYGVNSAPTVFLDGVREVAEGPREDAPEIFRQIDAAVGTRLEQPAGGAIHLTATIRDAVVTAEASASLSADARDVRLQFALVEQLVRYSGENGQRFHPMVVRALGGGAAGGFALDPSRPGTTATERFDLAALAADNLKYYDEYTAEMKARAGMSVTFIEKKHVIDPRSVAVVAFLQDSKTRRVLQAAWLRPRP
jgi:thiol-disulfide isomerase/thioredoxin